MKNESMLNDFLHAFLEMVWIKPNHIFTRPSQIFQGRTQFLLLCRMCYQNKFHMSKNLVFFYFFCSERSFTDNRRNFPRSWSFVLGETKIEFLHLRKPNETQKRKLFAGNLKIFLIIWRRSFTRAQSGRVSCNLELSVYCYWMGWSARKPWRRERFP